MNTRLNADFDAGAIAVKLYKVVGMELKRKDGTYVLPDDPVFGPIFDNIAAHHKTVVAHVAEPDSCWKAPDPRSPDYSYYNEHPEDTPSSTRNGRPRRPSSPPAITCCSCTRT